MTLGVSNVSWIHFGYEFIVNPDPIIEQYVRVSSRIRVKVRVSVMVRDSIRTSWVVNFALFRCYGQ